MSALVLLSLGCILEAVAAPVEMLIKRPRIKVYRKPNQKKERFC